MRPRAVVFVLSISIILSLLSSQSAAASLRVTVINMEDCRACSTEATEKLLKNIFADVVFEKIDHRKEKAKSLVDELKVQSLPVFIFNSASVEQQDNFPKVSHFFTKRGSFYVLNRQLSGIFFLLDRPAVARRIDLFLSFYDNDALTVVEGIKSMADSKGLTLEVHFVFNPENQVEVEECLRAVSVKEIYPAKFWDYLLARLENIKSSFWNITMDELGIDAEEIARFSLSEEAGVLLEKNSALTEELDILVSPVILIDNQRIFSVTASSDSLEDLLIGNSFTDTDTSY